jgi:hypothetical protein
MTSKNPSRGSEHGVAEREEAHTQNQEGDAEWDDDSDEDVDIPLDDEFSTKAPDAKTVFRDPPPHEQPWYLAEKARLDATEARIAAQRSARLARGDDGNRRERHPEGLEPKQPLTFRRRTGY